ncbi:hypothetical protein DLAC_11430 [Tieghemostelium lacteum]|uniref:CRAL-TRIO domain-containing protein n=1 Tax=Tieghemostelium lacteum TaxID=361077 RepID=A0A152A8M7_TIELA|nr:hypothetical protein DLAC_11430 [Tieghemostelium lacteum]|eukprot:KYR02599.1 hypothetical protein DLAC_11430 [Tieghemostelium lacteum]
MSNNNKIQCNNSHSNKSPIQVNNNPPVVVSPPPTTVALDIVKKDDKIEQNSTLMDLIQKYEEKGYTELIQYGKSQSWSKRIQIRSLGFVYLTRDLDRKCENLVVIIEDRIPKNDLENALKYLIYLIEPIVHKKHEILYLQTNTAFSAWTSKILIKFYDLLSRDTSENLQKITIVHPTTLMRVALSTFSTVFRSHPFIKKIHLSDSLHDLFKSHYNKDSLNLPLQSIKDHPITPALVVAA